jgi:cell division transport system permease protein
MTKFERIIKAGLVSFKRNAVISWASVLVMTITLSVITFIILLQAVLGFSLNQVKDKVDVTIYFINTASEDKIVALKNTIEKLPEVDSISYTSSEEALALFREKHSNDHITIQALDEIGANPLGGYLNIKAKEISQYESIDKFLKSDNILVSGSSSIIDKVDYHQNKVVIEKLNYIINGAQKLGFLITLVLIIISILITFNTIRLAIFIAKEEIGIMRLVGASKTRVRGPFMVEGAIYGITATIITMILFWPITIWLGNNMTSFLGINMSEYYFANLFQIFLILLLFGIFLGVVSSFWAVKRYLDK